MKENRLTYGLKNVHYAPFEIGADGIPVFEKPMKYPGAVEITNDAKGDATEFFADDTTYFVTVSNQGYEGAYTAAETPEDFRIKVLGETLINGLLVEKTSAKIKPVALLFEFDGDVKATRHALLNVTFNRPGFGSKTKESSIEPNTKELSYIAAPLNELTKISTSGVTPEEIYNNWFEEVQYEAMTTTIPTP
ncbi:major tail protein [Solibacillus sp. FSL K6-1523]|uniref:major tail protein n=1 Tax=Solibacillus sp. FSL K6-1523 TaxID=2921471 RepID=UPI0030FC5824